MPEYRRPPFRFPACAAKTSPRCRGSRRWSPAAIGPTLVPSFPAVTCPVQANMTTGSCPSEHGVVANGFYLARQAAKSKCGPPGTTASSGRRFGTCCTSTTPSADVGRVVSAAQQGLRRRLRLHAGADSQPRRQRVAVVLHEAASSCTASSATRSAISAAALLGADGQHQVDGLDRRLGRLAPRSGSGRTSSTSICRTSTTRRRRTAPTARRRSAPLGELDDVIGRLVDGFDAAYGDARTPLWLVASEYVITPVDHVIYPNRVLREAACSPCENRRRAS